MEFRGQQENQKLIDRLEAAIAQDKISHAYIFEGDYCIDKRGFAEAFVRGILCPRRAGDHCGACSICGKIDHGNYEDLIYIEGGSDSIKDAQIVEMQERLKTKPFGTRTIVIVEGSDRMTIRAQNRLLKTLEEPPGNAVIILLSENMENLVQTIQSRCVKYRLHGTGSLDDGTMLKRAEKVIDLVLQRAPFYQLKAEADQILKDQEAVPAFLDGLQMAYRNMLLHKEKGISLYKDEDIINDIYAVEHARKQLKEGVSAAYAVKGLLLKIGG